MTGITEFVGRSVEFRYRRHNFDLPGIPRCTELRHCRIEGVRDCEAMPIEPDTKALDPHRGRGRWLLECFDYDKQAVRSFYFEAMQDLRWIPGEQTPQDEPYTLVLVERPDDWKPAGPRDIPPNVELFQAESAVLAEARALGFNANEMTTDAPQGWWAIPPQFVSAEAR